MTAKERVRDALIHVLAPLAERANAERPRARVLSFHDVPESLRDEFARKLEWLARTFRIVTLAGIHSRTGLDPFRLNVALTFDDGFREHARFVGPLLRRLGLPAVFFVPSGAVGLSGEAAAAFSRANLRRGSAFEFVRSEEVARLAADPLFEIGGHTVSHVDVAAVDDEAVLEREIRDDKEALERLTGGSLRWFAFPFGGPAHVAAPAVRVIRDVGYAAAFTIVPSYWSESRDPYLVGRDCLELDASIGLWRSWLRGGYDSLSRVKALRHR
ncbi:MAG: polysaccharide deacetylase family protein [Gaiellaceae bacterium]